MRPHTLLNGILVAGGHPDFDRITLPDKGSRRWPLTDRPGPRAGSVQRPSAASGTRDVSVSGMVEAFPLFPDKDTRNGVNELLRTSPQAAVKCRKSPPPRYRCNTDVIPLAAMTADTRQSPSTENSGLPRQTSRHPAPGRTFWMMPGSKATKHRPPGWRTDG